MIRESLAANSKHAMMIVTPGSGAAFQWRASTGGASAGTFLGGVAAPYGVYLERAGNDFYAWGTADYVSWDFIGSAVIPMAETVYMGLAVTSHNNPVLNTSRFDYVFTSADYAGASGASAAGVVGFAPTAAELALTPSAPSFPRSVDQPEQTPAARPVPPREDGFYGYFKKELSTSLPRVSYSGAGTTEIAMILDSENSFLGSFVGVTARDGFLTDTRRFRQP